MSNSLQKNPKECEFEEDEIFDDSSFLAKLDSSTLSRLSESCFGESSHKNELDVSALCCDEEISGYDKLTGKTWIYPTNYPVRDYQFNIIKASILKNTLVSLPTGLGKTFIAAVIMYNFYRWYPRGKIIFTAPTRPLVAQQIEACYNIVAIPPNDTIEMTGHMQVNTRKTHWQSKRVFFATPQVIYNDIKSGICPGEKIRCLVIDEAHRARGNYAYCQIVSTLTEMGHKTYRILALSATPGSKVEDVVNVVKSLHIAHLELRTENCIDVQPYSHSRKINTVVIELGPELSHLRQQYVEILDTYARRLKQFNILPQNLGNLSKGRVVMLYKEYQNKEKSARHPQHNYIMKDFTLLIALYHGLELLVKHGSRVFLNFFDEHPEKSWIQADDKLTALLERLRDDLGVDPLALNTSILPDGTIPEIPRDICFGHPKFYKLKDIMMEHFSIAKRKGQDTRAIVFCEYRESVNLVHCLLLQCRPLIMPQMFVGQGASGKDGKTVVSQKQQLRVMRNFREGSCNVLVATCVAEEGLDVGSVDLILCFDISTRSPVRLVQRCGRTGRERGGQVFILVTEGREHQTLLDCMRQRDGLNKKILQSNEVNNSLYKLNPRMMPHDHTPQCHKMYITVAKKADPKEKAQIAEKPSKKGQKDLRTMLLSKSSSSGSSTSKEFETGSLITEEEYKEIFPDEIPNEVPLYKSRELWAMNKDKVLALGKEDNQDVFKLSTWLEWQRTLQKTINIGHSRDSEILSELLQYSDAKRFDLPASTQNPTFLSQDLASQKMLPMSPAKENQPKQKKSKVVSLNSPQKLTKSPGKRDGDIRALFSTATKSTKSYTKLLNDLGIQSSGSLPTRLINLLVDLSLESSNAIQPCYICQNVCDCKFLVNMRKQKKTWPVNFLVDPILPKIELIDDIDEESLLNYKKELDTPKKVHEGKVLSNSLQEREVDNKEPTVNNSNNFEIDYDFDSIDELNSCIVVEERTPEKNKIKDEDRNSNFNLEFDFDSIVDLDTQPDTIAKMEKPKEETENKFEIGDIDDIFAESSPEEIQSKEAATEVKTEKPAEQNKGEVIQNKATVDETKTEEPAVQNEVLGFFGLDSIDDIFADDDVDDNMEYKVVEIKSPDEVKSSREVANNNINQNVSPSILSGRTRQFTSPILCSQSRKFQLSTTKNHNSPMAIKARRQLIKDASDENIANKTNNSFNISNNKSMFTITQIVDMINKPDGNKSKTSTVLNNVDDDRSTSPILLTQADKKKASAAESAKPSQVTSQLRKSESLIILDSDSSDSDENTQVYDIHDEAVNTSEERNKTNQSSQTSHKRKIDFDNDDDFINASPYFNKKPKLENNNSKTMTLQQKVLAAITSNKDGVFKPGNNNHVVNFAMSPIKLSQKENNNPQFLNNEWPVESDDEKEYVRKSNLTMLEMFKRDSKVESPKSPIKLSKKENNVESHFGSDDEKDYVRTSNLKMLQMFKRDSKVESPKCAIKLSQKDNNIESNFYSDDEKDYDKTSNLKMLQIFKRDSKVESPMSESSFAVYGKRKNSQKRKLTFNDSDDDFVDDKRIRSDQLTVNNEHKPSSKHKVHRKKKPSGFLELEAELSGDGDSGDELSDSSAGSIAEFICDDHDATHQVDMHAHYIRSVRSPVKGVFKIPELPKKFDKMNVFSQFVEEDNYEMDSFCVDSHIGLTQADDISELELAEIVLEEKRKRKKKNKRLDSPEPQCENGDSPLVKRNNKVTRRIDSDSDSS